MLDVTYYFKLADVSRIGCSITRMKHIYMPNMANVMYSQMLEGSQLCGVEIKLNMEFYWTVQYKLLSEYNAQFVQKVKC